MALSTSSQDDVLIRTGTLDVGGKKRDVIKFDMTEKAIIKAMDEISDKEIIDFTSKMELVQEKDILGLVSSLFEFQGFDPKAIIRKLVIINEYYIKEKKLEEESRDTLMQDVVMMVCANVVMGNLQLKSMGRRSNTGRLALGYLVSKYQIMSGSTGAGLPSDTLTFPRIANSFPVVTCRAANVLKPKSFPSAPFKTAAIPHYMKVSSFASLCGDDMEGKTREFLLQCVCAYSCDQMITVHEGEKKKRKRKGEKADETMTPLDAYGNQWDYIVAASGSPVPSPEMKRAMLLELKVENMYSSLIDIVKRFREILEIKDTILSEEEFQEGVSNYISSKGIKSS